MKSLINNNYLQKILKMTPEALLIYLYDTLTQEYGYDYGDVFSDFDNYMVFKGNISVGLCAHIDTVLKKEPTEILYDPKLEIMMATSGGLGADDRAGVVGILELVNQGYRPTLIFCNYEETGGLGARVLSKQDFLSAIELKYLVEIDRKGENDCVFYSDGNEKFHEYVEGFGFKTAFGSFSDISTLCPALKISGVNLSTGYYSEHTSLELLRVNQLRSTINKISHMLDDIDNILTPFKFERKYGGYGYYGSGYDWDFPDEDDWYTNSAYVRDYNSGYSKGRGYGKYSGYSSTNTGYKKELTKRDDIRREVVSIVEGEGCKSKDVKDQIKALKRRKGGVDNE